MSAPTPIPGVNRQVMLAARPVGMPKESDFRISNSETPKPGAGECLIRVLFLSVDPYLRLRMNGAESLGKSIDVGDVMIGDAVGRVIESNDPRLAAGDTVQGMFGWQEYAVAHAKALRKVDPGAAPVSTALYALGTPGMTAYFGLLDVCKPQPGETVAVSAAAGAVGSLVGQIAKIKRCRVAGIAGSAAKVRYLTDELGFDGALNYREPGDHVARLKALCPNGIDVYFDNVGGAVTDAAMKLINTRARVAVCGQVSEYGVEEPPLGPCWMGQLVMKQAKVEGFLAQQFADRFEDGRRQMGAWLREQRIKCREDIVDGIENAPRAFIGMLQGDNIGKRLMRVGE
jgi:NADPH-dependent curcumin reductase CurA